MLATGVCASTPTKDAPAPVLIAVGATPGGVGAVLGALYNALKSASLSLYSSSGGEIDRVGGGVGRVVLVLERGVSTELRCGDGARGGIVSRGIDADGGGVGSLCGRGADAGEE